jgi:hypothetical protein
MNIQENNTLITYLSSFNDIIYTPEKCQKLLDNDTLDIALVTINNDITLMCCFLEYSYFFNVFFVVPLGFLNLAVLIFLPYLNLAVLGHA